MQRVLLAVLFFLAILVALAFLVVPVVAIFVHVAPGKLIDQLSNPVVHDALIVTLKTSGAAQALILLLGTPLAWYLATRRFPGRSVLVTLVDSDTAGAGEGIAAVLRTQAKALVIGQPTRGEAVGRNRNFL